MHPTPVFCLHNRECEVRYTAAMACTLRIFAVFALCTCGSPDVGGLQGGHGIVELLFGAVPMLCRNTPYEELLEGVLGRSIRKPPDTR